MIIDVRHISIYFIGFELSQGKIFAEKILRLSDSLFFINFIAIGKVVHIWTIEGRKSEIESSDWHQNFFPEANWGCLIFYLMKGSFFEIEKNGLFWVIWIVGSKKMVGVYLRFSGHPEDNSLTFNVLNKEQYLLFVAYWQQFFRIKVILLAIVY